MSAKNSDAANDPIDRASLAQRSIGVLKRFGTVTRSRVEPGSCGFWVDGDAEYVKHLETDRDAELAIVRKQLESASTKDEQERCKQERKKIEEAHQSKLAELPQILF